MSESLLPYAVGAAKRARTAAVRVRRRVERMHTVPAIGSGVRPRPLLRPVHISVLGGRTLNVAVPYPHHAAGLAAARLELARGTRRVVVELTPEPQRDDTVLLTATIPLHHADHPEPGSRGVALASGVWRFALVITDGEGRETRTDIAAPPLHNIDGPTLPTSPSPSSGAVFRPVRSVDGRAMLKVSSPAHQAELVSFDLRWDRITVHGRLIAGRHPTEQYTAEAVRRGASRVVGAETTWQGDSFTFDLPLAAMTAGQHVQRTWDVQLRVGRTRLKVARRLTDVRHLKQVFRTPYRIIALEDGSLTRVHAYVTPAGSLAVACAAFGINEDA